MWVRAACESCPETEMDGFLVYRSTDYLCRPQPGRARFEKCRSIHLIRRTKLEPLFTGNTRLLSTPPPHGRAPWPTTDRSNYRLMAFCLWELLIRGAMACSWGESSPI
jgi:hypothetical protein